jgi:hypothetical protein
MKRKSIILLVAAVFLASLAGTGAAGIEPVPWRSQINWLDAVGLLMSATERGVMRVVAVIPTLLSPDDGHFNGLVGNLGALSNQLDVAAKSVNDVIMELKEAGVPIPTDTELVSAFTDVASLAQTIARDATPPTGPDPCTPGLLEVKDKANAIYTVIQEYLGGVK